jgi:hypothetical protein
MRRYRQRIAIGMMAIVATSLVACSRMTALRASNPAIDDKHSNTPNAQSQNDKSCGNSQPAAKFALVPPVISGGDTSMGMVVLKYAAPSGGVSLTFSSENPAAASGPGRITVPAGATVATFAVASRAVKAATRASLFISYDGSRQVAELTVLPSERAGWYVAPNGSSTGKGTPASPWDLGTALAGGAGQARVKPGDTIWIRSGRYTGAFTSLLAGNANAPIIVRQYPGERAILDRGSVSAEKQPALKVKGPWVWFWGLEVMNSDPNRSRSSPYTGEDQPWRGSGADVYASNVKFINMIFHDNGHGIWDKKDMTEVDGCLFYYNGDNKREHALYIGNNTGTKFITDNIIFDQAGYGILSHSNSPSSVQKGIHIEGNASFNNGILTLDDQMTGNLQVGGVSGVSAERITIEDNYVYNPPGNAKTKNNGIRLGYEDENNKDVELLDNYIVSNDPLRIWWWKDVEAEGNTIYSQGNTIELKMPPGRSTSAYRLCSNTYISGKAAGPTFIKDGSTIAFGNWQQSNGLDRDSQVVQNSSLRPSGVNVFVRPNRYEVGRANIIVYNWDKRAEVAVDVGAILPVGASYEVRDAQNYFGEPVARGTYNGGSIKLPMNLTLIAPPIGKVERVPSHTAPEFAVFVLQQISAGAAGSNVK